MIVDFEKSVARIVPTPSNHQQVVPPEERSQLQPCDKSAMARIREKRRNGNFVSREPAIILRLCHTRW